MVVVASRARDVVVRAVPSPVRRAAGAVAALGAAPPAEATVYLDLLGSTGEPPASGLQVLRRTSAVALTAAREPATVR